MAKKKNGPEEYCLVDGEVPAPPEEVVTINYAFVTTINPEKLTPQVHMILRLPEGSRKSRSSYSIEDIQDASVFGCKVDTWLEYKRTSISTYSMESRDNTKQILNQIDARRGPDFSRFYNEIYEDGYNIRFEMTIQDVLISMHNQTQIAGFLAKK